MVRAQRAKPDVYFGQPGSGYVTLPWPRNNMDASYEQQVHVFETAGGSHRVSRLLGGGGRIYSLNWSSLHQSTFDTLNKYWLGQMGLGPYVLIDPSRPNLLTGNQSAATALFNDARGFTVAPSGHGALSSNQDTTHVHRTGSRRSLLWSLTGSLSSFPLLTFDPPYRNWYGIPVVVGLPYAFSVWVKPVTDTSITIAAKISWRTSTDVVVSEPSSGGVVITDWTKLTVIGAAPATTVYALPLLLITGSSVTTPAQVYVDEPVLEQDMVVNDWAPGTGLMPVQITAFNEMVPFDGRFRLGPAVTIREVVG